MILKDLLDYFNIEDNLPDYLLEQPFNEVFLDGDFEKTDDTYKIEVTTRQDVTHQMFIRPGDEFPLIIMSVLPNGNLNGMKFGQNKGDVTYINEL
ncbi:hypothetical protein [uncultured Methanobrevibacter sp.]|uniref:hypothetical protein n=1 Tax=uncultured Methanobrevibacter sp. TaxID=253161 RepID=UPI0025F1A2AC|nr:hypothetical protein [uncultured Methanobrevibacter sp.]